MIIPMTRKEVARALGMSETWVEVIELRAISKLAAHFGRHPAVRVPRWVRPYIRTRIRTEYACKGCGEPGHNRQTCAFTRGTRHAGSVS